MWCVLYTRYARCGDGCWSLPSAGRGHPDDPGVVADGIVPLCRRRSVARRGLRTHSWCPVNGRRCQWVSIGTENVPVIGMENVPVRRLPRGGSGATGAGQWAGASQSSMRLSLDLPRRRAGGLTPRPGLPGIAVPGSGVPGSAGPSRITGSRSHPSMSVPNRLITGPIEHQRPKSSDHRPNRASVSQIVESQADSAMSSFRFALSRRRGPLPRCPPGGAGRLRGASVGLVIHLRCLDPRFSHPGPS